MKEYPERIPLILNSMGKDSQVVTYLVRSCYPDIKVVFNNTTLDCADTYRMAKQYPNCIIMSPKKGFYQRIKEDQIIPTRLFRFCCRIFKSGEMVNQFDKNTPYMFFCGIRCDESAKRADYTDERVSPEWGKCNWLGILPIRQWNELDVWMYTMYRGIEINNKYKKGYTRAGCAVACPYANKNIWCLDKYWYPYLRNRWEEILKSFFINNKKWLVMNCTIDEYVNQCWNGGVFREEPTEEVINEYAAYNNLAPEIAKQYFNKYCQECKKDSVDKLKKIKDKEVLAMNLKLHGRNIDKFYCKKHLKQIWNLSDEEWNDMVEKFKSQGCDLF